VKGAACEEDAGGQKKSKTSSFFVLNHEGPFGAGKGDKRGEGTIKEKVGKGRNRCKNVRQTIIPENEIRKEESIRGERVSVGDDAKKDNQGLVCQNI